MKMTIETITETSERVSVEEEMKELKILLAKPELTKDEYKRLGELSHLFPKHPRGRDSY